MLSSALQFGNAMLITGIFPAGLLSMLTLSFARLDDCCDGNNNKNLHTRLIMGGCLLAGLTLSVKYVLASIAGTAGGGVDDSHIWDLLSAKFDPRFYTFDTKHYLCAAEFGFYEVSALVKLSKTLVLPTALATVTMAIFRLPRVTALDRAHLLVILLLVAALAVLAGLISRLNVLSEYSNYHGPEEVVNWILENTEPFDSFVGPMTIMATVRVTTFCPIYNHPHNEDAGLRRRTRQAYSLYSRKPLDEIWHIHTKDILGLGMFSQSGVCASWDERWGVGIGQVGRGRPG